MESCPIKYRLALIAISDVLKYRKLHPKEGDIDVPGTYKAVRVVVHDTSKLLLTLFETDALPADAPRLEIRLDGVDPILRVEAGCYKFVDVADKTKKPGTEFVFRAGVKWWVAAAALAVVGGVMHWKRWTSNKKS